MDCEESESERRRTRDLRCCVVSAAEPLAPKWSLWQDATQMGTSLATVPATQGALVEVAREDVAVESVLLHVLDGGRSAW